MNWPHILTFPREPDFVIGGADDPYLRRWWTIPPNKWFNVYLHHFLRSDDPRALHDHPRNNMSIILAGSYIEHMPGGASVIRNRWRPVFRRAEAAHRIELPPGVTSVWTLFIVGPRVREWGFHCPNGWRHWQDFCAPGDSAKVGRGCDD